MAPCGDFLGFHEDLSKVRSEGTMTITPKADFPKKVQHALTSASTPHRLTSQDSRVLVRMLVRLCSAQNHQCGRSQLHHVFAHIYAVDDIISHELRCQLCLRHELLKLGTQRITFLRIPTLRKVVVYTDAACIPVPGQKNFLRHRVVLRSH